MIARIQQNPGQGFRLIGYHLLMIVKDPEITLQMIDNDFNAKSGYHSFRVGEFINILFILGAHLSLNDLLSKAIEPECKNELIKVYLLVSSKRGKTVQLDQELLQLIKFDKRDITVFWDTANIALIEMMIKSIGSQAGNADLNSNLAKLHVPILELKFRNIALHEAEYLYQLLSPYVVSEEEKNEFLWRRCNTIMLILFREFNRLKYVVSKNPNEILLLDSAYKAVTQNPDISFLALESHLKGVLPNDVLMTEFTNIVKYINNWHAVFAQNREKVIELQGQLLTRKIIPKFLNALLDIRYLLEPKNDNQAQTSYYESTVLMYFNLLNSFNISNVEWLSHFLYIPGGIINNIFDDKLFRNYFSDVLKSILNDNKLTRVKQFVNRLVNSDFKSSVKGCDSINVKVFIFAIIQSKDFEL